jgi:hypothetical protein
MSANITNLKTTLAILKRAEKLNMYAFQMNKYDDDCGYDYTPDIASTEAELHKCGNSACIAGYVAVSPEWRAFGGLVGADGGPILPREFNPVSALAKFWGLSHADTHAIISGGNWPEFLRSYKMIGIDPCDEYSWDRLTKEQAVTMFEQIIKWHETHGADHVD